MLGINLENLKLWQWLLVGTACGALLGWSRAQREEPHVRSMTQSDFELKVKQQPQQGLTALIDVRAAPGSDGGFRVTGEQLFTLNSKFGYEPFEFDAPDPFVPQRLVAGKQLQTMAFPSYLAWAAQRNPNFKYQYNWWAGPRGTMLIYACCGAVLLGIAWPLAVQLMVIGGLGIRRAEPSYRFNPLGEPAPPADLQTIATSVYKQQLDHLIENLHLPAPEASNLLPASPNSVELIPRKLSMAPKTAGDESLPVDDKHYAGQFYPTTVHHQAEM